VVLVVSESVALLVVQGGDVEAVLVANEFFSLLVVLGLGWAV
jgi:hypothetical protein